MVSKVKCHNSASAGRIQWWVHSAVGLKPVVISVRLQVHAHTSAASYTMKHDSQLRLTKKKKNVNIYHKPINVAVSASELSSRPTAERCSLGYLLCGMFQIWLLQAANKPPLFSGGGNYKGPKSKACFLFCFFRKKKSRIEKKLEEINSRVQCHVFRRYRRTEENLAAETKNWEIKRMFFSIRCSSEVKYAYDQFRRDSNSKLWKSNATSSIIYITHLKHLHCPRVESITSNKVTGFISGSGT